jgi:HK97 family phage major capsid protein
MELAEVQDIAKKLSDTNAELRKQQTELVEAHKITMKAVEDVKTLDKTHADNIDKALTKANETGLQVKELAQQLDEALKKMKEAPVGPVTLKMELSKSMESDANKAMQQRIANREGPGSLRLTAKATIGMAATATIAARPYTDDIVNLTRQPLRIRDLLPVVPVVTESIRYAVQNVRNNNAAIVAEGASKPYSDYGWTEATMIVQVIAHLAKLSLQAIADVPRLVAEVENEMRYGLGLKEESELLNGTSTTAGGQAGHFNGLLANATQFAMPAGVDTSLVINQLDRLRIAQLVLQLAYAPADGQVLNPIDVANLELVRRDPDRGGGYIFGNPDQQRSIVTLWGVPTVQTPAMAVGNYLMGNFAIAATIYQREGVTALISTENADDFEKNLATMRVEERLGLAVRRPWALVKGALGSEGS